MSATERFFAMARKKAQSAVVLRSSLLMTPLQKSDRPFGLRCGGHPRRYSLCRYENYLTQAVPSGLACRSDNADVQNPCK